MRHRTYIDTSVIGGCEDEEFSEWSIRLFEEVRSGERIAVVSDLTREELELAPDEVRQVLVSLPDGSVEDVLLSEEARALAQRYLDERVVGPGHTADAQHIAIASVERVDVVVSWNFRDIVNLERIHAFNSVNLRLGYAILEIRSPREVVHEKEV